MLSCSGETTAFAITRPSTFIAGFTAIETELLSAAVKIFCNELEEQEILAGNWLKSVGFSACRWFTDGGIWHCVVTAASMQAIVTHTQMDFSGRFFKDLDIDSRRVRTMGATPAKKHC